MSEKSLICINTCCARLPFVQAFAPAYLAFCAQHPEFDFILSLDGDDAEYRTFCTAHGIPILYSEAREGVGLAKNRVLAAFAKYDHYFFIEDDVELVDGNYFRQQIELARELDIPHFSLHPLWRLRQTKAPLHYNDYTIYRALYGSAQINYFTRAGLERVGGWHTDFARYRRWGHTEHTYRYWRQGLVDLPFHVVTDFIDCFLFHDPPSGTVVADTQIGTHGIAIPERELIEQQLTYFPVTTLAPYRVIGRPDASFGHITSQLAATDSGRFPFLTGRERLELLSLRRLTLSSDPALSRWQKLNLVLASLWQAPAYLLWQKISVLKKILLGQW